MSDIFNSEPKIFEFLKERKAYLGDFLKTMREAYNLTQQDVSDVTGYSIQTISKIENGKTNPMGVAGSDIFNYLLSESGNTLEEILNEFSIFAFNMRSAEEYDERLMQ